MGNPLMKAMQSATRQPERGNIMSQFLSFCQQMKGKNPQEIIRQELAAGRITQEQYDHAAQKAGELMRQFGIK